VFGHHPARRDDCATAAAPQPGSAEALPRLLGSQEWSI